MTRKYYILSFLLLSFTFSIVAQDTLLELTTNNRLRAYHQLNGKKIKSNSNKALLTLPFFDDFSQENIYPDGNLWQDINVHINKNFADNPITYGVATFEGLDSTGYPYNFANPNSWGPADTLTSHPIDLTTVIDSVYLSFYYQARGMGNKPETKDSLRLEFFRKSDSTWVRKWGVKGSDLTPFTRVMVPVDTSFQNDEFQFRFMNWATLSANADHWNLDYIYLDENRNYLDTVVSDVSFITNHQTMLTEFMAMPWSHYKTDTISFMAEKIDATYKNNDNTNHAVFYEYQVWDDNGAGPVIETYPPGTSNFNVPAQSIFPNPSLFVYDNTTSQNFFYFPPDTSKTKVFQIKNYFDLNPFIDDHPENDTVNFYQVFGSYYAYDDGSAEIGYGVQGIGSKLAHEFNIKKNDTLTAFQIYFNPMQDNHSGETFRMKVWSSLNPEVEVYTQTVSQFTSPIYSNTNDFLNYPLNDPVYLTAGTYYFGWEKISAPYLNVGWDLNTNNKTKVHFNSVGVWQNASFDGTLMLRPVFGYESDPAVSIEEQVSENEVDLYPNPANNTIYFSTPINKNYTIEFIDLSGKILLVTESNLNTHLNINNIANGVYIVRFTEQNSNTTTHKKVVISK